MSAPESDVVRLKFIFPYHNEQTIEAEYSANTAVMEVKDDLLMHRWPEACGPVEDVGKLRMFYCGKELNDNKTLRDYRVGGDSTFAAACHVSVVPKGCEKKVESPPKPKRCMCTIC